MQSIHRRRRVLFVCAENSCRSQIAEGWARHLHGRAFEAVSAALDAAAADPRAVRVMAEVGVDLTGVRPVALAQTAPETFDHVVVLGNQPTPIDGLPNVARFAFEDPRQTAAGAGSDEEAMIAYRRVRNELRPLVESLPDSLEGAHPPLAETS